MRGDPWATNTTRATTSRTTTPFARCRELLGDEADGLSDEEIDRVWRHADAVAHVIVEMFLNQRADQESQL